MPQLPPRRGAIVVGRRVRAQLLLDAGGAQEEWAVRVLVLGGGGEEALLVAVEAEGRGAGEGGGEEGGFRGGAGSGEPGWGVSILEGEKGEGRGRHVPSPHEHHALGRTRHDDQPDDNLQHHKRHPADLVHGPALRVRLALGPPRLRRPAAYPQPPVFAPALLIPLGVLASLADPPPLEALRRCYPEQHARLDGLLLARRVGAGFAALSRFFLLGGERLRDVRGVQLGVGVAEVFQRGTQRGAEVGCAVVHEGVWVGQGVRAGEGWLRGEGGGCEGGGGGGECAAAVGAGGEGGDGRGERQQEERLCEHGCNACVGIVRTACPVMWWAVRGEDGPGRIICSATGAVPLVKSRDGSVRRGARGGV